MTKQERKHNNKALKAVYFVNKSVNPTSYENWLFDYDKAQRKTKSFWYHVGKK